jgi:hypothetical protein
MQYKMVFCDIDGTLIDSKHQISKDTGQKIRELSRAGIPFIMVSARMPSGIFPLQNELQIKAPIVCYSGALILDEHGDCAKTSESAGKRQFSSTNLSKRSGSQFAAAPFPMITGS